MNKLKILCWLVVLYLKLFDKATVRAKSVDLLARLSEIDIEGEKIYKPVFYNLMKKEPIEDEVQESETNTTQTENEDLMERQFLKIGGRAVIWPKGVVPYLVDRNSYVSPGKVTSMVEKGMAIWSSVTCVEFLDTSDTQHSDWASELGDKHFVKITSAGGCKSYIGKDVYSKKQDFQMLYMNEERCMKIGTVLHELGHLLGLVHEQMRSDRDQHIVVNMDNVRNFYRHNFYILQTIDNTKFDYGSIMHYGVQAFSSNNKDTISLKDSNLNFLAGQREYLSFYDIKAINLAYQCNEHCPAGTGCQNDGYVGPDCNCNCPSILGGDSCDAIADEWTSDGCSSIHELGTDDSIEIKSPNYPLSYGNKKCAWMIKGPSDKNLSVSLTMEDIPRNKHSHKCFHSVEIRFNLIGQKGLSFCGYTTFPYHFESLGNSVLIILHGEKEGYTGKNFVVKISSGEYKSACLSNPCRNFGQKCIEKGVGKYECSCSENFSGMNCSVVESISCGFDWNQGPLPVCLFAQNEEDNLDWIRRKKPTVSSSTGPSADVTGDGSYMYMESSFPAKPGDEAILDSALIASGQKCVSFYYHMYGNTMGELHITMVSEMTETWAQEWMKAGNQGDKWKHVLISVTAATKFTMHIRAVKGSGHRSDIAIDSLTVSREACNATTTAENVDFTLSPKSIDNCPLFYAGTNCDEIYEAHCNFNSDDMTDFCIFRNAEGNDINWKKHKGETPSRATGPSTDISGDKYYLYTEASIPARPGYVAKLETDYIQGGTVCVHLHIHMYGADMGTLVIMFRDVSNNVQSDGRGNSIGYVWKEVWFGVQSRQKFKITIESIRGSGFKSDIAIDDFHLSRGTCPGEANQIILG